MGGPKEVRALAIRMEGSGTQNKGVGYSKQRVKRVDPSKRSLGQLVEVRVLAAWPRPHQKFGVSSWTGQDQPGEVRPHPERVQHGNVHGNSTTMEQAETHYQDFMKDFPKSSVATSFSNAAAIPVLRLWARARQVAVHQENRPTTEIQQSRHQVQHR